MATFLKRQKEMKRQEKQRDKAERRKQKKLAKRTESTNCSKAQTRVADLSERSQPYGEN